MKRRFQVILLSLAFAACLSPAQQVERAPAPDASPVASPVITPTPQAAPENIESLAIERETSEPYAGDLSIFEDEDREKNLQVERVMDLLGIREGSRVADIGAGSGWFTVRAARRVSENGSVYAVEINEDYLKHIERRAADEKLPQIRAILGKEDDPLLPESSVDAVLLLKTYHEIAQPVRLLSRLRKSLSDGALVGVIDREGKGDNHGVAKDTVVEEAARAGFELVSEHDFVKTDGMDYFLIFRARKY